MQGGAGRHDELAGELIEWWEDLWQRGMTSRVVLVAVPPGWGRTAVLDRLAERAGGDDAPVTLIIRINGRELPDGIGLQAAALRECLAGAAYPHRVAELLGLDRLGGSVQVGIGIAGLFASGLAAGAGFLVAGLVVGAGGKAWDASPAGQDGAVARAARAVAATSARVPVVVIIDDADCLDESLALAMIGNLAARQDGHVLVVAAVAPDGALKPALTGRSRAGVAPGLVHVADADPDMGFGARSELTRTLRPGLPEAAVRRIARGTVTFKDVFAVAAAPRLAEIGAADDEAEIVAAVDTVLAARLDRPGPPSAEAVVIAWAGGLVHARQAARALAALGEQRGPGDDREVLRWEGLERLADPASPPLARHVAALAVAERRALAAALLAEALAITGDPGCGLIDRVAAAQAAHRVRGDLAGRDRLPRVQRELAAGLEELGEPAAARQVAISALDEWPPGDREEDRDWLAAAAMRLSRLAPPDSVPPEAVRLIGEAVRSGAVTGLEARIWAAIDLLADPGQREAALALAGQAAADLDARTGMLGAAGTRWRLLLAFHVGRAGQPTTAAQILAPLLNSGDHGQEDAAHAILQAIDGPRADTRLQNIILEAELATLPADADDDRLRIHHALAANHVTLGQYRQALAHGQRELDLRNRIQGRHHPDTLTIRGNIAFFTGQSGDAAEALRLSQALLPDRIRVFGPDHPDTLTTRGNIAHWTGLAGDPAGALRLSQALLPDQIRVLGPDHPDTLSNRDNIAFLTLQGGDAAGALRMLQALLPDRVRVLGPDHPDTLSTRHVIELFIQAQNRHAEADG
jgi:tetratricopeptide (TPR) repeat protein